MPLFFVDSEGCFTKQLSARWAIVQLAGRRILVPLIVVQVHVAQPTRTQTSPSSSRPRTAAFHAVNSGSNPLGDANRKLKAHHFTLKIRVLWCVFLYYKHPALVKPSPQGFQAEPSPPCALRPSSFRALLSPRLIPQDFSSLRRNRPHRPVLLALVIAALCICGLASPSPFSPFKGGGQPEPTRTSIPSSPDTSASA